MASSLGFHIILACMGIAFPAIVMIAHYRGLRYGDGVALLLARRWSKVMAVLVAVGAVSGTVLSFDMGLLWPGLMGRYGSVIGIPFTFEGVFFLLEAVFTAIYLFGWDRLPRWAHFWSLVPVVVSGILGALSVVAANSWMNDPSGYTMSGGQITRVDPVAVFFNGATAYEVPHMVLAAYMVAGGLAATPYAVGLLRGRRDRYHRLGFGIPFTVAVIATPFQIGVGDTAARAIAAQQPVKFASMEYVPHTTRGATEWIAGIWSHGHVVAGIPLPDVDSLLVGFSPHTRVVGWDTVPAALRPPLPTLIHLSFDLMVGIGTLFLLWGLWLAWAWWRHRDLPGGRAAGVPGRGRAVRDRRGGGHGGRLGGHRGRSAAVDRLPGAADQPGGHHGRRGDRHADCDPDHLRHPDGGHLGGAGRDDAALASRVRPARGTGALRATGPGGRPAAGGVPVIADVVAAVLVVVSTAYAALAGADFGGGIWDLLAGSTARGAEPRRRIDQSITPVWESNHVWLVIALVILWTGFPAAFAAIFTTLFVPLSVAALGIVLRGAGFAFRAQIRPVRWQMAAGGTFALSSLLTPFFLGTVIGAVVTGRVHGSGDPVGSWVNPTSLLTGVLFVAVSAYLAAVYLTVDSERDGEPGMRSYFLRRALAAAVVSGALAAVTLAVLHTTANPVFTELLAGRALPLVVISVLAGAAVLILLIRDMPRAARPMAVIAVAAVICGWALAQYPYLLPPGLTVREAAAPAGTEAAELVVVALIVVLVGPSFVLLFRLAQRGRLAESEPTSESMLPPDPGQAPGGGMM